MTQLTFDSFRPQSISILHSLEDSAIGWLAHPTPFNMQFIVAILLNCAQIAERLPFNEDITILNAIHFRGFHTVLRVDIAYPSREIFTIKQLLLIISRSETCQHNSGNESKLYLFHFL